MSGLEKKRKTIAGGHEDQQDPPKKRKLRQEGDREFLGEDPHPELESFLANLGSVHGTEQEDDKGHEAETDTSVETEQRRKRRIRRKRRMSVPSSGALVDEGRSYLGVQPRHSFRATDHPADGGSFQKPKASSASERRKAAIAEAKRVEKSRKKRQKRARSNLHAAPESREGEVRRVDTPLPVYNNDKKKGVEGWKTPAKNKKGTSWTADYFEALEKDGIKDMGDVSKDALGKSKGNLAGGFSVTGAKSPDVGSRSMRGNRAAQMLTHMSRVGLAGCIANHEKPVEVQYGYAHTRQGLQLYGAANNEASCNQLATMLENPRSMFESALSADEAAVEEKAARSASKADKKKRKNLPIIDDKVESPQCARAADRLLRWEEREKRYRRAAEKLPPGDERESELHDLDLANQLHAKFMNGDVTVPTNEMGRHAEQNIAKAMSDDLNDQEAEVDIQGTKWRCLACTAELGPGHEAPHRRAKDRGNHPFAGRFWSSQAHPSRSADVLRAMHSGETGQLADDQSTILPDSSESESESSDDDVSMLDVLAVTPGPQLTGDPMGGPG